LASGSSPLLDDTLPVCPLFYPSPHSTPFHVQLSPSNNWNLFFSPSKGKLFRAILCVAPFPGPGPSGFSYSLENFFFPPPRFLLTSGFSFLRFFCGPPVLGWPGGFCTVPFLFFNHTFFSVASVWTLISRTHTFWDVPRPDKFFVCDFSGSSLFGGFFEVNPRRGFWSLFPVPGSSFSFFQAPFQSFPT